MQTQKGVSTLIGIIIIVAVVIVVFGGIFGYQYSATKNNQSQIQDQQQTVNQQINNNQSADLIAGWKTYTNSEYGFEIKYPAYFSTGYSLKDWFLENAKSLTGEDFSDLKTFLKNAYGNVTEINAAGKKAYLTIVSTSENKYIAYIEAGNGYVVLTAPYTIQGSTLSPEKSKIEDIKIILSTFKFTK